MLISLSSRQLWFKKLVIALAEYGPGEKDKTKIGQNLLSSSEIAETLWLARLLPSRVDSLPNPNDAIAPKQPTVTKGHEVPANQHFPTDSLGLSATADRASDPTSIPSAALLPEELLPAEEDFPNAVPVWIEDPPLLENTPDMLRAIAPLLFHKAPTSNKYIDEIESVEQTVRIALSSPSYLHRFLRILIPVIRQQQEPYFDLILLVDGGMSMLLWIRLIPELRRVFSTGAIFWRVRIISLFDKYGNLRNFKDLAMDSMSERSLALLVSDCAGTHWWDGSIMPHLQYFVDKLPIAVMQMLPRRLWDRTALGLGEPLSLRSTRFMNLVLRYRQRPLRPRRRNDPVLRGPVVPVITCSPSSLSSWCAVVLGDPRRSISGFRFPSAADIIGEPPLSKKFESSAAQIADFRRLASPQAIELAGLLAAAPVLTLPVMRLVKKALMGSECTALVMAEVLLSGLLHTISVPTEDLDLWDPHLQFSFGPGLREELLKGLADVDRISVVNAVSSLVERRWNRCTGNHQSFRAFLTDPSTLGSSENQYLDAFALVMADLIKPLGKSYEELADNLQKRVSKHTHADIKPSQVRHNLPNRPRAMLGREDLLRRLKEWLSFETYDRIITITGSAGVGKTTLVLEAAYSYLTNESAAFGREYTFDLILFLTASRLSSDESRGLDHNSSVLESSDLLLSLYRETKRLCESSGLMLFRSDEQIEELRKFLESGKYQALIILDDLDLLGREVSNEVLSFFKTIRFHHFKVILTLRSSEVFNLHLEHLPESETLELIDSLLKEKNLHASNDLREELQKISGGIPLVITYSIELLALSGDPETTINKLTDSRGDLLVFCFEALVSAITAKYPIAYVLLLSISLSSNGLLRDSLFFIADVDFSSIGQARHVLDQLCRSSLIVLEDNFYKLLPLTRNYVLSQLVIDHNTSLKLRNRWLEYYLQLAKSNSESSQGEWLLRYKNIDEEWVNFRIVFKYCFEVGNLSTAKSMWRSLSKFMYVYGYWTDLEIWTNQLIDISLAESDNAFLAELLNTNAWNAILRDSPGSLQYARDYLMRAWEIKEYCTPVMRNKIALNLAVCYSRRRDFHKADFWFVQKYKKLVKESKQIMPDHEYKSLDLRFLFYFAERYYLEGNYDIAIKIYFQVGRKTSSTNNLIGFYVKVVEKIAYLQIKNRRFDEARVNLDKWYPVVMGNPDKMLQAFFRRDYAELEFQLQNIAEARRWATDAQKNFLDLGLSELSMSMDKYILTT